MKSEQIQQRIESYTAALPQAVQSPNGARFAMLLSLIASNQEIYRPPAGAETPEERFEMDASTLTYPDPNELYSEDLVERLNHSINAGERGEYAYLVSYLDTRAQLPRNGAAAGDDFQQLALTSSGRMMLDTIDRSRATIRTSA